jgi:molybdopterin molybdotransferase
LVELRDDCFAQGSDLMRVDAALEMIEARIQPAMAAEEVPLSQGLKRVLAEDLKASGDVPPADNAAVDGYALRHQDLSPEGETLFDISAARAAAGYPMAEALRPGQAARIFTGAQIPEGADSVVMQEDCEVRKGRLLVPAGLKPGANRRRRGEDLQAGAIILRAGQRLRPQDLGLAATAGHGRVKVAVKPKVALFSTGDELREPGQDLNKGQIYDSNRYTLTGLLQALGCDIDDLGILPDRAEVLTKLLGEASSSHDLVITSGGISVGDEDHVKDAVNASGGLHFWRLAIKPGRPLALGQLGGTPFVGLPGNPVAVMVTFVTIIRPMILRLMGARDLRAPRYPLPSAFSHRKKPGRREWLRGILQRGPTGGLALEKYARDGSGIASSLVASDGLIELPEDLTEIAPGLLLDFLPYRTTVAELLDWLASQGPAYETALAERQRIRVAVNQSFAEPGDAVVAGDEVAIFPPVTGG